MVYRDGLMDGWMEKRRDEQMKGGLQSVSKRGDGSVVMVEARDGI